MATETEERVAHEFPSGAEWLNVGRPLQLRDLRGKVVLLYFWTYSCLHCLHILPDLKRLEEKYPRELVVVGVHSARFPEEQTTSNLRQALRRYQFTPPVVNDRQMILWRLYDVRAWPTLILISPEGNVMGRLSGERVFEVLDEIIGEIVNASDARRRMDRTPLARTPEPEEADDALLSFPGKMVVDRDSGRGFITDSNHHRLVIVSLPEARVIGVVGSGEAGLVDGHFAMAQFRTPQGLTLAEGRVYVADTGNHALRVVDLERRTVTTLAGTGEQAAESDRSGPGKQTRLNSPWEVVGCEQALYITMAGRRQIWRLDLRDRGIHPFAGNGQEARVDGPLRRAAFAQPAGIATDGRRLYVADSEANSVRAVDLDPEGKVTTLAGGNLFVFGDRDGPGLLARFQRPLGIAYDEGVLYIADSYNHKIKRHTLATGLTETLFGGPAAEGLHLFREPRGLWVAGGTLYVADANGHAIRVVDLRAGTVETLTFRASSKAPPLPRRPVSVAERRKLTSQTVGPGAAILTAALSLPAGCTLDVEAPNEVRLRVGGRMALPAHEPEQRISHPTFPVQLPVEVRPGEGTVEVEYDVYFCGRKKASACLLRAVRLVLPVRVEMSFPGHALQVSFDIAAE